jgi:hypothetical protein
VDSARWREIGEAYVQQWTVVGANDEDDDDKNLLTFFKLIHFHAHTFLDHT